MYLLLIDRNWKRHQKLGTYSDFLEVCLLLCTVNQMKFWVGRRYFWIKLQVNVVPIVDQFLVPIPFFLGIPSLTLPLILLLGTSGLYIYFQQSKTATGQLICIQFSNPYAPRINSFMRWPVVALACLLHPRVTPLPQIWFSAFPFIGSPLSRWLCCLLYLKYCEIVYGQSNCT